MNGEDALHAIRQLDHGADVPVIALTAYAMKEEQERFMKDGFDGYISKPVEIEKLVEEIERVILGTT
jgi:CheY-like chemotaxis protein